MNTVESSYVFGITFLVIASLISSTIKLHQKITGFTREAMETEWQSHQKEEEKTQFRPEALCRAATLLESDEAKERSVQ